MLTQNERKTLGDLLRLAEEFSEDAMWGVYDYQKAARLNLQVELVKRVFGYTPGYVYDPVPNNRHPRA